MFEIAKAKLAPNMPKISESFSPSQDKQVATTCTSFLKSLGNSGLIALSIILEVKTASSVGLDSLFKNLPLSIKGGLYHSWGVCNSNFPECLKITTISADGIIMGVSHKIYDIKGLQFHPESIMTDYGEMIIRNWLSK
jgi:hypothetical protein